MRNHRFLSSLLVLALVAGVALGASSPAAADNLHTFGKKIDGTYFLAEEVGGFPAGSRIVTLTSEGRWLSIDSTEPGFLYSNQQGDWKKTGAREITATILNFNHDAGGSESGVTKGVVVMTFTADYQMVSGSFTTVTFAAGDNPHRIRSEAAWAHLCGVAPIPASSGKIQRHRLNRGGNRQANSALYRIVLTRMSNDERTKTYVAKRTAEGKTIGEIARILKRYVAREVYPHLPTTMT